jgi:hypothetical protein
MSRPHMNDDSLRLYQQRVARENSCAYVVRDSMMILTTSINERIRHRNVSRRPARQTTHEFLPLKALHSAKNGRIHALRPSHQLYLVSRTREGRELQPQARLRETYARRLTHPDTSIRLVAFNLREREVILQRVLYKRAHRFIERLAVIREHEFVARLSADRVDFGGEDVDTAVLKSPNNVDE